ncbi:MAG: hypothetical protein ACRD36_08520 [Candidatus Acidiferrum sp.]
MRIVVLGNDQWQAGDAHKSVLAREGGRLVAAPLLGETRHPMFARLIKTHPVALPDCEAARDWEVVYHRLFCAAVGAGLPGASITVYSGLLALAANIIVPILVSALPRRSPRGPVRAY